jgi:hypothetical protein
MATITLNPYMGNYGGGSSATSALKSISFFLLFTGLVMITIGYVQQETRIKPPRVEYRYVPRSFKEEQAQKTPILSVFGSLFQDRGPWQKNHQFIDTYPWQRQLINSRVVQPYNNPVSGFNRGVGQRIIG